MANLLGGMDGGRNRTVRALSSSDAGHIPIEGPLWALRNTVRGSIAAMSQGQTTGNSHVQPRYRVSSIRLKSDKAMEAAVTARQKMQNADSMQR
ncbi:hypothetical protein AWB76_07578 [Caballeronia temeraria]|uniref:Uncharacterized protein n=1 Tax=Caballeronia temeraria TaxID=1777137 RepID=A0A158DVU2_9BURK|nr:hypothetical protein AWB76_07578 [Caballeronia temeraria]